MSSRCRGQFSQMGSQRLLLLFRKEAHSRIITRPAYKHTRSSIRATEALSWTAQCNVKADHDMPRPCSAS